jgi:hypothetical protein
MTHLRNASPRVSVPLARVTTENGEGKEEKREESDHFHR